MPSSEYSPSRWCNRGYHCVVRRCLVAIGPQWLFCVEHWVLVPPHLKKAIHSHFQEKRRREFVAAVDVAIAEVEKAEAA